MRKLVLLCSFFILPLAALSQNLERHNWYFGNSTQAIRFNRVTLTPSLVTKTVPFGSGGSSTASSPLNGNLLFYTDGNNVFDATNLLMPNGNGLTGTTTSNQPTAICPVPGEPDKYFIFTNTAAFPAGGNILVSVVDMNLFGNAPFPTPSLGDLESKNVAVPGMVNRAEGMIIIPAANGIDFFLVTQQINSQVFSVTTINAASYTGTYTTTNITLATPPVSVANFSYHAASGRMAASAQDTNTNASILTFDNTTGALAFDREIPTSGLPTFSNQSIYDIEFSRSGRYLYLSRHGDGTVTPDLLQYDYNTPTASLVSILPGPPVTPVFRSFGLQMAPDSMIYHLYQTVNAAGPILLGRIDDADSAANLVIYSPAVLSTSSFTGTQFPNFAPRTEVILNVDFTFTGLCQNNNTTFFPDITPGADSVRWDFGDGSAGSIAWSPVYEYGAAQTYSVTLTAFYQNQVGTATKNVAIQTFALQLDLVQDTTACRSEFPPPRGTSSPTQFSVTVDVQGGTATSYIWSNGDTGPILTPDSAGYYYVVVTDGSGCSAYAGVNVREYGLQDQRRNIWYFGNRAGIDFNQTPPVALDDSAMDTPEGCAIICDRNGQTIFYTDGDRVFDRTHALIASGIGGEQLSTQSSIVFPVPGDETLYYIFTTESVNDGPEYMVRYSLFDLKENGGLGAVVQQDLPLFARSTERLTASGNWLIVHEYGNNSFRAYPISPAGIGQAVITAIGSDHFTTPLEDAEGYMKFGPNSQLVVAINTPGASNVLELFTFNPITGTLSNFRRINLNEPAGQVYGVEFSPGGNKIFATVTRPGGPSDIFEYFLDSVSNPWFKQRITQTAELGAIQIGPDGTLYVAVNGTGSDFLGTIAANDDTTQVSSFTLQGFALAAATTSRLGLPNFVQQVGNSTGGPSIDVTGVCLGSPTQFIGTPTDAIDHFSWTFGDGGTAGDSSIVEHTYALASTYTVNMRLTNRCNLDTTVTTSVTIFNPPPDPTILGGYALCNGPVTIDANTANLPGLRYIWTRGDTTQVVVVTEQSLMSVTITDVNGCTSDGSTVVSDERPVLDLGPDPRLCQNDVMSPLDAQNPGPAGVITYTWTVTGPNGGPNSTNQTRPVLTANPGVDTYSVTILNTVTTCTLTEDLVITVQPTPSINVIGANPSSCGAADGSLSVTINGPTGPYQYGLTGPSLSQTGFDVAAPFPQVINTTPTLGAGTYVIDVIDQLSSCSTIRTFGLSDSPFTALAAAVAPNCDPVSLLVTLSSGAAINMPLDYTVLDNTGLSVSNGINVGTVTGPTTAEFTTNPITKGTYTGLYSIEVDDNGGCTFVINNFAINPAAEIPVTFTDNLCTIPPTIVANAPGATTFNWSVTGPGSTITSGQGTNTISITGSTISYSLDVTGPGVCPNTEGNSIVLDNPAAGITQSDPCTDQVDLTASPSGINYNYIWYLAGSPASISLGQVLSLGLADNGNLYEVEVTSTLSGCTSPRSPAHTAQVVGQVDAGLTATIACEDGQPFTLTAVTAASPVTYAWFRDGILISGETASTTLQTTEGTYKVEITKSVCTTPADIIIERSPIPVGLLPNQVVICNDPENTDPSTSQVDLDPGAFTQYDWFKNELSLGYTARVFTADSEGLYRVNLTNTYGCEAPDEVEVLNDCQPVVEAPNAFRPTSSVDLNKNFFVITSFITDDFSIFIFNRWGELIFTSNDKDFEWNGGVNNSLSQPAPGGSYSYVIRYTSSFRPEKGVQEKRGGVALLR